MLAMIGIGVGELFGTLICGFVMDRFGPFFGMVYTMVTTVLAFVMLIIYVEQYEFSILTYFMILTWGF
jgi:predicted MFS family arabinose efflux permease